LTAVAAIEEAQAAISVCSLRGRLSRRERHRKNRSHQNRSKNNRKIVARRTRAPHPSHQMSDSDKILKSGQVLRIWREVEYPRLKSLMYRAYSGKFARPKASGEDYQQYELVLCIHHRSGLYGLIDHVNAGSQFGTVGLRIHF
jgi:hypothetical protein